MRSLLQRALGLGLLCALGFGAMPMPAHAAPPPGIAPSERLDLNSASLEEVRQLPISSELAEAILEHREYIGYFSSIYDLARVPGMTPEIMGTLRNLVSTLAPDRTDEALERYDESFRQVERFLSEEGASEEVADEYLDLLRVPRNINDMSLYELQSLQNVTPIDAVAVVKARDRMGSIEGDRQMRGIDGLSYWGYRNLRDYVVYGDPTNELELHGDIQMLSYNTPYSRGGDEQDIFADAFLNRATDRLTSANPAALTKLRLRLGREWKGGILTFRDVAEEDYTETVKGYVHWHPSNGGDYRIDNLVVGNFRVAFGQGLVMDNTDFFMPRKTGYGWNKRPLALQGDVGRSDAFALRGAAVEFTAGRLHGTGFLSVDDKDAVMNPDTLDDEDDDPDSINRRIVMTPRLEQDVLDDNNGAFVGSIERDAFQETLFGGNVKLDLWPGTYVGVTGYEAQTDVPIDPQVSSLFNAAGLDRLQARDSELYADYSSTALGDDFQRVVGAEFQTVIENVAVQGEYAKLDSNPDGNVLTDYAPEAWLINAFVQYDNLSFLALYRDYDLGFDNPYARGFSNDTRYEQTLLGDPFRLNNELLSFMAANTPQMKPEKGFFFSTRYRISRALQITGLDYDQWTRVADGQDMRRWTLRAEYAPIWPLRFRLRQRFSSRGENVLGDVRRFQSWDTRLEARFRLSAFDEVRMLYSATNTEFVSRPRLSEAADPVFETGLGQGASPGQALQAQFRHNVNEDLMVMFSSLVYDGFLWNFEDNEFVLLDGTGFRNWILVRSRLSDRMLMRFKVTSDHLLTKSSVLVDRVDATGENVRARETAFRLQLDYTF